MIGLKLLAAVRGTLGLTAAGAASAFAVVGGPVRLMASPMRVPRKAFVGTGLLVGALLLMAVGPLAGEASASHFRQGNLNWKKASGAPAGEQRVTVQYEQSWRADAFGPVPARGDVITTGETRINWGDGSPVENLSAVVEFVNVAENYMRIQALAPGSTTDINVPHDYADPIGTFQMSSTSCCTIGALNNADNATWNILSTVNLAGDDESAVSTIPAIVTLPAGGIQKFTIPAGDGGGETLSFRLTDANESCAGCADPQPPGISVNSSTGEVTVDTTGLDGLNWTGVVIESRNLLNQVVATTHIQYIISIGAGGPQNQSPVWDSPPTPADGTVFTVAPGDTVNFTLQASDPDAEDSVSILQNSGPGTFTATDGNPATASFSFTATDADLGNDYIVQFIAQDIFGAGPAFRSYTISVRATPPTPAPTPPTPATPAPTPTPTPTPTSPVRRVDRAAPRVAVAGVQTTSCVRASFSARFRIGDASRLRRVVVTLDGRTIKRTTKKSFPVRVRAATMRSGRHVLRVIAIDRAGNRRTMARSFRRCARPTQAPVFTG
jgi:hypothetical protein